MEDALVLMKSLGIQTVQNIWKIQLISFPQNGPAVHMAWFNLETPVRWHLLRVLAVQPGVKGFPCCWSGYLHWRIQAQEFARPELFSAYWIL
jgi:hypothetical protein